MGFAKFMAGTIGRVLRLVLGLTIVYTGFFVMRGMLGDVVGVIGFVPVFAAIFNVCLLAPIFGASISGRSVRHL